MPRYLYNCTDCNLEEEIFHGMMDEVSHCPSCNSKSIHRVPQMVHFKREQVKSNEDAGDRVRKAIEENRAILKEEKKKRVEIEDGH